jgi:prolipoprotein diacylglyceryl transferase
MQHFIWSADPVALSFGPFHIFWYGILFAVAILSGLEFMKWVYPREGRDVAELDTLFIYIVVGIVVGARLGHCFFYDPEFYLAHPMKIFAVWEGGLASHGGGLGVILALYLYCKKYKVEYLWLLDRIAIPTALFAFFVRMGNFMNSEIIGKPTDSFFGIIFSRVDTLPRHPTQLYEAFSYLLIFFVMSYIYKTKATKLQNGFLFGLFLLLVFSARFLIEFVKTKQADYTLDIGLTTGQLLSIPFLVLGTYLLLKALKRQEV